MGTVISAMFELLLVWFNVFLMGLIFFDFMNWYHEALLLVAFVVALAVATLVASAFISSVIKDNLRPYRM